MSLNRDRALALDGAMVRRGTQAASGRVVDPLLVSAMYDDPDDARDRMDDEAAALLQADVVDEQARAMGR